VRIGRKVNQNAWIDVGQEAKAPVMVKQDLPSLPPENDTLGLKVCLHLKEGSPRDFADLEIVFQRLEWCMYQGGNNSQPILPK
jgi:hypothetical protein